MVRANKGRGLLLEESKILPDTNLHSPTSYHTGMILSIKIALQGRIGHFVAE